MFSVQSVAAKPYLVLLAISTASAGVRKVVETNTGTKDLFLHKPVGWMQTGDQSGRVKTALWYWRLRMIGLPSCIALHQLTDLSAAE